MLEKRIDKTSKISKKIKRKDKLNTKKIDKNI